jgi:hypothetical protein
MLTMEVITMPHKHQRYSTAGDYVGHERLRFISISEMGNSDYEFLVAIHEMIEQALCIKRGISDESITRWDKEFQGEGEPGDDQNAPYHKEHVFATAIEYSMAKELGIDIKDYEKALEELK